MKLWDFVWWMNHQKHYETLSLEDDLKFMKNCDNWKEVGWNTYWFWQSIRRNIQELLAFNNLKFKTLILAWYVIFLYVKNRSSVSSACIFKEQFMDTRKQSKYIQFSNLVLLFYRWVKNISMFDSNVNIARDQHC